MEDEFFELTYKTPVRYIEDMPPYWRDNLAEVPRGRQLPRKSRHLKFLSDLELSVRTTSFLEAGGVETVKQLIAYSADELLDVRNFGETSLTEVRRKLAENGLLLKGD
jgi:DNA-directed RNA polymerase alpha subunit